MSQPHLNHTSKPHHHPTNSENAAAVGAGAAALGAVIALTVSSTAAAPIVGAIVAGAVGATGGAQVNNIVKWWRHGSEDTSTNNR
jgi:hypothetical protein